jgi:hypothetical protein
VGRGRGQHRTATVGRGQFVHEPLPETLYQLLQEKPEPTLTLFKKVREGPGFSPVKWESVQPAGLYWP